MLLLVQPRRFQCRQRALAAGPGSSPSRWRVCLQVAPHHCPLGLGSGSGFAHWFTLPVALRPRSHSQTPPPGHCCPPPLAMLPLSRKPKQTPRRQYVRTGQRSDRLQRQMCPKKRRIRLSRRTKISGMSRWKSARCRDYQKNGVAEITGGLADRTVCDKKLFCRAFY